MRIALLDSFFGDTSQEEASHADNASVSAIVYRWGREVRIFVRTDQFVPLTETPCDVRAIFYPSCRSPNPTVLVTRRCRGRVQA
jgi:hypothetical protein